MSAGPQSIANNLLRIRERMDGAAWRARRCSQEITLVCVSKMHPAAQIREAYEAGVRHFGENRVQEWESKRPLLEDLDANWHLLGHLQSNKAARAGRLFHSVDSLDSASLAERLERVYAEANRRSRVLIEVKLDPGPAKSGVREEEVPELVEAVLLLGHLELRGLMGVPPYFEDVEKIRPYFRRLRELRDSLRGKFGGESLPVLSMGMSHDFEVAIEEGSTEIRVGTALLGARSGA